MVLESSERSTSVNKLNLFLSELFLWESIDVEACKCTFPLEITCADSFFDGFLVAVAFFTGIFLERR